jgi:hypothetical protein
MQKKPPRCKYVMYPARPTLLLYTWNLPYIRPEAKKTPQVQICNISGRTYIIGIHMESAIYPAGGKKNPRCRYVIYPAEPAFVILKISQWPNPILQQYYHLWYTNGTQ